MRNSVLFIVGPTAVGKSKIALEVALELQGEIISADSMQVYRGMDIGTAKPTKPDRAIVPHHLIDILDPSESFSAFDFYEKSLANIRAIAERGCLPMVVGGTGFYIRTLLAGISPEIGDTREIREKLDAETAACGLSVLYDRLKEIDPDRANKIMPRDKKRILRALEIFEISGKKPSTLPTSSISLESLGFNPIIVGLTMDRKILYERIQQRVDQMFDQGLLSEVQQLKTQDLSKTAQQAVGYKEILDRLKDPQNLDKPLMLEKISEDIKMNTRHLAKRQWTWFRKEKNVYWLDALGPSVPSEVIEYVRSALKP